MEPPKIDGGKQLKKIICLDFFTKGLVLKGSCIDVFISYCWHSYTEQGRVLGFSYGV